MADRQAATIEAHPGVDPGEGVDPEERPAGVRHARGADGAPASAVASRTTGDVRTDPLPALQLVADELATPQRLEDIAGAVARSGMRTLDAEALIIALCEGADRHLRVVHASGLPKTVRHRLPMVLAAASSLLGREEQPREALLESIAAALLGARSRGNRHSAPGSRALVALIPPPARPLGMIVVGRMHERLFSNDDRAFLNVLASLSGLALERLWLLTTRSRPRPALHAERFGLPSAASHLRVGDMELDLENQQVAFEGRQVRLTPSELRLMLFLAATPGRPRTRREILRHLWHTDHVGDGRACDAHISNLRRKIERDPSRPERVVTLRGVGYTLRLHPNSV